MSLYDGIELKSGEKKNETKDTVGWSSGLKLMQSQIQLRKASLTQMKKEHQKSGRSSHPLLAGGGLAKKPKLDLIAQTGENGGSPRPLTPAAGTAPGESAQNGVIITSLLLPPPPMSFNNDKVRKPGHSLFGDMEILDEYNPLFPNDYDKLVRLRDEEKARLKASEKVVQLEDSEQKKREKFEQSILDGNPFEDEELGDVAKETDDERRKREAGAAIAPPTFLIEQDKKMLEEPLPSTPGLDMSSKVKGLGVAARIMEKYGYKHGAGLGKQEQGMSTALQVEKVSKRGGKIIHEKDKDGPTESITDILRNPTKVVLLRNMVGRGEVDGDLEPEIKEECAKYGDITKVNIFEIPDAAEDECVRIFLEFGKMEQAIKAVVDLNGRFFGGRTVKAGFYNLDKFRRFEFGD